MSKSKLLQEGIEAMKKHLEFSKNQLNKNFYSKHHSERNKHPDDLLNKQILSNITDTNTITIGYPVQADGDRIKLGKTVKNIQVSLNKEQSIAFIKSLATEVSKNNIGIKKIPNVGDKSGSMIKLFSREALRLAELLNANKEDADKLFAIKAIQLEDSCKAAVATQTQIQRKKITPLPNDTGIKEPVLSFIYNNDGYILVEDCGTSISNPVATTAGQPVQRIPGGLKIDFNNFMRDIVNSIHKLHQNSQIYHLDIKPNNIVICGETYKLIDFGVSLNIPNTDTKPGDTIYSKNLKELKNFIAVEKNKLDKLEKEDIVEKKKLEDNLQLLTAMYVKYNIKFQGTMSYFSPAYYALTDLEYNLSLREENQRRTPGEIHKVDDYHTDIRYGPPVTYLQRYANPFIAQAVKTAQGILGGDSIAAAQKSEDNLIRKILIQQDWFALGLTILNLFKENAFALDLDLKLNSDRITGGLIKLASVTDSTETTATEILAAFGIPTMRAATLGRPLLPTFAAAALKSTTSAAKSGKSAAAVQKAFKLDPAGSAVRAVRALQAATSGKTAAPPASQSAVPNLPPIKRGGAGEYKLTDYKAALPNQTRLRKVYKYMKKYYVQSKGEWIAVKVRPATAPK
jgi:serine/threonine protein kinase